MVAGLMLALFAYSALGHPGGRQAERSLLHPVPTPPSLAAGGAVAGGSQPTTSAGGSQPAAAPSASNEQGSGSGSAASMPLVVLDNTGRPDQARFATGRFEHGGWTVTDTSTFDGEILSTAAYYDPDTPGAEAAAQALQAQFPEIQRVRPKFDGLGSGPVIVILTYDYSQGRTTS